MSVKKTPNFAPIAIGLFIIGVIPLAVLLTNETKTKEREKTETEKYYADLELREAVEAKERKKDSIAKAKARLISKPQPTESRQKVKSEPDLPSAFEQRHGYPEKALMDSIKRGLIKD
jgi:hypothetical protein